MYKIINMKSITELNEEQRFELISTFQAAEKVFDYIKSKLQNLTIEILGDYVGNIMELMNEGLLEGWCWQTTESAIVFLEDDDYIERGNLKFEKNENYWHSWICFNFESKKYIFDPCLKILVESSIYYRIFEVTVAGKVTARQVREDFIYRIKNNPEKKNYSKEIETLMKDIFGEYLTKRKNEIWVSGNDDVNSPMYRNNTGYYNYIVENGQIKNLIAHYYLNA